MDDDVIQDGETGPGSRVKVAVRIRPLNKADGGVSDMCLQVTGDTISSDNKQGKARQFQFDNVFYNASQDEVYSKVGSQMLVEAFQGYNTTMFAYGQTGSGKTYTIQGDDSEDSWGIIPRLCTDLFGLAEDSQSEDSSLVVKIQMSFLEVYNERIHDLLQQDITASVRDFQEGRAQLDELRLTEDNKRSTLVKGLSWHTVVSYARVQKLLAQGSLYRQRDSTKMNELSSRSHSVLTLIVNQQHEMGSGKKDKVSRITIVDLAGSERSSKTGVEESAKKVKEMEHINLSLLTLGRCLNVCSQGGNRHIPVRDSVLTRILADVFGGNSKTIMIANVSPSIFNFAETINTLEYATSAKKIIVRARVNNIARAMEVKELREQVKALGAMFQAEMEKGRLAQQRLAQEKESLISQLNEKDEIVTMLRNKLEEKDAEVAALRQEIARPRAAVAIPALNMAVINQTRSQSIASESFSPDTPVTLQAEDTQSEAAFGDSTDRQEHIATLRQSLAGSVQAPFSARTGRMTPRMNTSRGTAGPSKELKITLQGHSAPVYCCAFSRNGEKIVSGSRDRTTRVWDARKGVEVLCMHDHNGMVLSVDINHIGTLIVTSSDDRTVKVWDSTTGERLRTMRGHTDKVYGCKFSSTGEEIVTTSCDRTIKVWHTDSGRKLVTLRGHTSAVFAATFSHKGDIIVSVSDDRSVRLWNWKEGTCTKVLDGHAATIWGVSISPDDSTIATASMDGTVKLWSIRLGASFRTLRGHTAPVHDVLFIENGTKLVSTGRDRTVRVWEVETGANTRTLSSHTHTIYHIAVANNLIVSCSSDESLKIWDITL
jgi:kinesin family protein 13